MFTITTIKLKHRKGYDVTVTLQDTDVPVGVIFQERKPTKETLKAISIVAKVLFKDVTDDMEEMTRKQAIFANGKLIQVVKDFLTLEIKFIEIKSEEYIIKRGRNKFSFDCDIDITNGRAWFLVCPIGNTEIDPAIELHTKIIELGKLGLTKELILESFAS